MNKKMEKEIDYLKEHFYEIYKYKKSMADLTYDIDLEHLLRVSKALDYSQKERNKYKEVIDKIKELTLQRKHCEDLFGGKEKTINDRILELLEEIE